MKFEITEKEMLKLLPWIEQQEIQAKTMNGGIKPQHGEIDARFTYCFTVTSIGTYVIIRDNFTKQEINLTDFNEW